MKNQFNYSPKEGTILKGYFNIYQAKNGSIHMIMGNNHTRLAKEQIEELHIDLYEFEEFDHDGYLKYYNI